MTESDEVNLTGLSTASKPGLAQRREGIQAGAFLSQMSHEARK